MSRYLSPALFAGVLLSAVGVAFNVSHGWALGGSDWLRAFGMAGVFLGCIALKDSLLGQLVMACKDRRFGLALVCALGFFIGAVGSFMAAFGSASEGREEKSDPRAAQISAFRTAEKTAKEAEIRLADIGRVATVAEIEAKRVTALTQIEAGIARRTQGCTVLSNPTTGPKVVAANTRACAVIARIDGEIAKAKEAVALRATLAEARETIKRGAPKSADATADNLSALWKRFTGGDEIDVGSLLSLLVAIIVEIGAPVAWAIWQMSAPATARTFAKTIAGPSPEETFADLKRQALAASEPGPLTAMFSGEQPEPTPPRGGRRTRKANPANVIRFPARHPVVQALEKNGGTVASNHELAVLMGVTDGEASKRWQEIEHLLDVTKVGKALTITLRRSA